MPSGQPVFPWRVSDAYIGMRGLVVASLLILLVGGADAFRICAFNAHRLTLAKVIKESVMDTLVQILARCDIMVLQEVVDSSQNTVLFLLQKLQSSRSYSFLNSSLLGRSTYKEKYVYIYRSDKTQVLNFYQYNDTEDIFAREPFVAQFTLPSKILPSVVLVPLHTTPKDVEKELNALYDVFLDVSQRWQNEVGVIAFMGEGMVGLLFGKTQQLVSSLECDSAWRLQCRLCITGKKTPEQPATQD